MNMEDKILFVLPSRKQLTLKQRIKILTYMIMGYKIEFIEKEPICRGYRANMYYMYDVDKLEMIK